MSFFYICSIIWVARIELICNNCIFYYFKLKNIQIRNILHLISFQFCIWICFQINSSCRKFSVFSYLLGPNFRLKVKCLISCRVTLFQNSPLISNFNIETISCLILFIFFGTCSYLEKLFRILIFMISFIYLFVKVTNISCNHRNFENRE